MKYARLFLAVLMVLRSPLAAASDEPRLSGLEQWFNSGRCTAFKPPGAGNAYPKANAGNVLETFPLAITMKLRDSMTVPWYVYDPRSGIALRHIGVDSGREDTLRFIAKPPPLAIPQTDLRVVRTASGIHLGSTAASLRASLGAPHITRGCGLERFEYAPNGPQGPDDDLDFILRDGRVIEMYWTMGG